MMMKRSLALLLVAQVAMGLLYSFVSPIFEVSDEIWHYPVVREIVEGRGLPVQEPGASTPWRQEGSQPPLYYLIGAGLTSWIDISDYPEHVSSNPFHRAGVPGTRHNVNMVLHPPEQGPWQGGTVLAVYLIRWLSVLMGTATAYFTYRLVREIDPDRPPLALLAAGLVAFNPMVLMLNGSVNNDNLLMLFATLALWLIVRDVRSETPGPRWRSTVVLGIVLGLGVLTKVSALLLLPVAALGVTVPAWRRGAWRTWWVRGLTLVGLVLLISGWWFVRNYMLYGELLGIERMVAIAGARPEDFGIWDLRKEWFSFWYSFWGLFGAFNILSPFWFYRLMSALSLVAVAGMLRHFVRRRRAGWVLHLLLAGFILITFAGLLRWTLQTPASQGRLMFPAIAAIGFYLALGLLAWLPRRWQGVAARLLPAGLAVAALVIALTRIAPAYRPPAPIETLPEEAVPLELEFGHGIQMVGYQVAGQVHRAGEPLEVTFYWAIKQPIEWNINFTMDGLGYNMESIVKVDTWPGGGLLPTSHWEAGKIYPDTYRLPIAADAVTPTRLQLDVYFRNDQESERLPIVDGGTRIETAILGAGGVVSAAGPPEIEQPAATFQHGIVLRDYRLAQRADALELSLEWTTTSSIPKDYRVFAHLYDAEGNVIEEGKVDGPPRQGFWPTSMWRVGKIVPDTHTIALPPDLPAGEYTVRIGLYDPETVERLFAYDPSGQEWRDWAVALEPAIVLK